MIGYLFLAVALLCGAIKGYCGKKSGGTLTHPSDAMLVNTVRMLACIFIGLAVTLLAGQGGQLLPDGRVLAIGALSGIGTAVFVVTWLLSVQRGAYMLVDVFLLLGVIVPILLCRVFYDEPITWLQWIGIGILLAAGYIMCTYNTSVKGKMKLSSLALLVLCALSYGLTDFSQKMFVKTAPDAAIAVFNLYTYLFAAIVLLVCFFAFRAKEKRTSDTPHQAPGRVILPILGYVIVMAVCLFLNSYFKTAAAKHLDATQIYPLSQGGSLILSMLMSALLFRERINFKAILGVVLSFGALLLINVL